MGRGLCYVVNAARVVRTLNAQVRSIGGGWEALETFALVVPRHGSE